MTAAIKCPTCGTGLEPQARFCGACGHQLTTPAANVPAAGMPAAAQVAPSDPYIGTLLNNRFQIESKLGEGGFGAVYRGVQKGTGRVVALKLLHPEMTRDANLLERFRREGLVLCNLRDAHTITTYDFDQTEDGTFYIAMELLEGKSLHDVFHREAPIEWRRMMKIAGQMCSSLAEAHDQGVVHRDLKPENIHLEVRPGDPEFVKILDFGIAKLSGEGGLGGKSPQLTAMGQTLGTLEYMSPEQLMGKPLDGRSDVYAIGVVSYELITGALPFPDAKGPAQLITAQLRQTPKAPSEALAAAQIPAAVDACLLRMLEKDKNKRFADVTELRTEIEQILAGVIARPQTPAPVAMVAPATPSAGVVVGAAPSAPPGSPGPVQFAGSAAPAAVAPQANYQPGVVRPQPMARPQTHEGPTTASAVAASAGSKMWLWLALVIVVIGGGVGALIALS